LLLPGDIFATRRVSPVLQQLESPWSQDISVNDTLKPVSRYWDRINRPEQLVSSAVEAVRVLTDQADTGAVTLALPQDVQAEAFEFPERFFDERTWHIGRPRPDRHAMDRAVEAIRAAEQPLIIAGGGVIYSEAAEELQAFAEATGIPVAETQAGKGSLRYDHPSSLGGLGASGTPGANLIAREADLVIGIGTRYSDITTSSRTGFQNPDVRFVNINIAAFDAHKQSAIALTGDARAVLADLRGALAGHEVAPGYRDRVRTLNAEWDREVGRVYALGNEPLPSLGEVIGAVNDFSEPLDVVVAAAGALPGELHRLWRTRDPAGYHVEYGYSTMGYEVAGGMGVKMAAPEREVYVMVGDGSWLMMSTEIVTTIQENVKLIVILIDNHGFSSIGALSESVGSGGFGTEARYRGEDDLLTGGHLPIDLAANAASLGASTIEVRTIDELKSALAEAKASPMTTVIKIETDRYAHLPSNESWWDVPVAEVSELESVRIASAGYEERRTAERTHL
ncbi:MAG: 3D-(3,5/4)-trihydroxycyclohexane-1,2-dione acylhydrolase (decyclizing), partial [Chloroflexi bacterium]|nr:3D-(3,5/4)-trihydroxycyclohexane-1,2-dione acylhydrolase (decyclizing) [Chloroflexota bacterium]